MGLFSVPGSILIKTMLVGSLAEVLWCTQTMFLSKRVQKVVVGRQSDAQTIKVPGFYTLMGKPKVI